MIDFNVCQVNYKTFSIVYFKFTAKSVEEVKKEKKWMNQRAISYALDIINCIINAAYVKKDGSHPWVG